ncbi:MAG: hypothetical protein ABL907_13415, partial [Hyphomicrobium sp.]
MSSNSSNNQAKVASTSAGANLLVDGSFETAGIGAGQWTTYDSVGGWKSDSGIEIWGKNFITKATDGDKVMELDAKTDAGDRLSKVWQDVKTEAGAEYTFNFDYSQRTGTKAETNTIEVWWNGEKVGRVEPGSTSWANAEFKVKGTGGTDRIEFREEAGDDDSYGGLIDKTSLTKSGPSTAEADKAAAEAADKAAKEVAEKQAVAEAARKVEAEKQAQGEADRREVAKKDKEDSDRREAEKKDKEDHDRKEAADNNGKDRNSDDDKHDGRGHGDGDHNDDGHSDNGRDGHGDGHEDDDEDNGRGDDGKDRNNDDDKHDGRGHGDGDHNDDGHSD